MKILFIGINYAPEPTGIAVYTSGMAQALVARGHEVTVICAPPHFPRWKLSPGYSVWRYRQSIERGVRIIRCPTFIPSATGGAKRILHYLSFALSSALPALWLSRSFEPNLVFAVAPSLMSAPGAQLAAAFAGGKSWLHIQDFEVEAAFATRAMSSRGFPARLARGFERWILRRFDRVSAISPQMCRKLEVKGINPEKILELRNWADESIRVETEGSSPFRREWDIETPFVALYSGSIGNKQGIEIIIDAARLLRARDDLMFVICGNGPNRTKLERRANGLQNILFRDLQPTERLSDLLALATIHLLPQIATAADLVLPSKLSNMLASGRPVIATAVAGTGLAIELENCGVLTAPNDVHDLTRAIETLVEDQLTRTKLGIAARRKAVEHLSHASIITKLEGVMTADLLPSFRSRIR